MAKIQTVNQLISVFKDIATRHYQINGFGIGDDWENGASEEKMHPVLWINPVTASMPESESTGYKTFEIDFEVRVFDLVSKGESNENDVLSDCIDILKDIILEFKGHPYYVNSQLNIIDDISFEAFTEEFDEEVSGWVCELSLMTPILNSFCGIPAADITGFEFPGIDCPDVNVLCPVFVEDVTGVYPIVVNTVGTTKEVSIAGGGLPDTFVVSGVYDTGTLTLTRNDAVDVVVTGFASGGDNDYTTAATLTGNIITFDRTDTVGAYSVDLTTAINSAPDKFVSSGAYDEINNKIVLTLNDASTVDIDTSAIGGGGASIYTDNDTIGAGRVATLTDTLTFKDGTVNIQGIGTAGSSALTIYDNDTTPNKLWDFLDNGTLNKGDTLLNIGNSNSITGATTSYALGWNNNITGGSFGKLAIGDSNILNGSNSYTVGRYNNVQSSSTFQFGNFLSSTAKGAFIIGHGIYSDVAQKLVNNIPSSLALGWDTTTPQHLFKKDEVVLCSDSKISSESITLAKPTAIKGVGAGTGSIVSLYNGSSVKEWDFLDNGSLEKSDNIIKIGNTNTVTTGSGGLTIGVGNDITAGAFGRFALGDFNDITNSNALVIGRYNKNTATHTVGIGYWTENTASGAFSIGVGVKTDATQKMVNNTPDSLALGWDTTTPQHLLSSTGATLGGQINLPNLPTSATGLATGDLWNDGGTLKIA